MRIVSVNVGGTAEIPWGGRIVRTSIRKRSVDHPLLAQGVNLAGDDQTDRSVHGGPRKSIYVYPSEHYAPWRAELGLTDLPWGAFGENLTTEGWMESHTRVGDELRIGAATGVVTQPRTPCYKLEAAFQRDDLIRRFLRSGRSGFYLGILTAGEIGPGDTVELLRRADGKPSIAELFAARARAELTSPP